ncbi:type VII secretion protein EccB [Streptomyces iconiensis]|uniref:Type VII secretion protein EccB n=1 Tax=Streptomyces iconiensis TaxID=1384038 RepID=A0ABT6ZUA1_9ACTN|nr:type VII secretion protein EccB [Streptomyces iconiensis]MDJ1132635.1 type VII secretion protein EccB [Streptomyces iconiensis]
MASRRDELNAYTFAKKRMVAAFLQPSPTGTEEGAPRPLRGILPGIIIGVVILAGFGAWGMFKPKAPDGWDKPKEKVIIGSDSTTRYVVLRTDGKTQLHPVLNLASAKLILDPGKSGDIVEVDEKVLDSGKLPHGPTIGIPYAPDRLPEPDEAGRKKRWAVCERPSEGQRAVQKGAFVLGDRDRNKVEGKNRLHGGELLFVQGPDDRLYVVDRKGRRYALPDDETLLRILTGNRKPQRVSRQWLATLHQGDNLSFPQVPGRVGSPANVPGLDTETNKIGTVIRAPEGNHRQQYLVLNRRVMPVSDFVGQLLLSSKQLLSLQQSKPYDVNASAFSPTGEFPGNLRWPEDKSHAVNSASTKPGSRNVACNVLRKVNGKNRTTLSTWSGDDFPEQIPAGSTSAYVTPGTGQLFRQVQGRSTGVGGIFLVTDTGLRYAMQSNSDSERDESGIGEDGKRKTKAQVEQEQQEGQLAQRRLGYEKVKVAPIPVEWSTFLPTGPRLSTGSALQPQGS